MFTFPAREDIPQKFWKSRCAFVCYTKRQFHGTQADDPRAWDLAALPGKLLGLSLFFVWWNDQLGAYGFSRGNGLEHNYKIAGCAYLLSQYVTFAKHPEDCWIDPPVAKEENDEERRERFLREIKESAAKDAAAKAERDAKIASGEITLPVKNRPFELWVLEGGKRVRKVTQRSFEAIKKSAAQIEAGAPYFVAHCHKHEDHRLWLKANGNSYKQPVEWRN